MPLIKHQPITGLHRQTVEVLVGIGETNQDFVSHERIDSADMHPAMLGKASLDKFLMVDSAEKSVSKPPRQTLGKIPLLPSTALRACTITASAPAAITRAR